MEMVCLSVLYITKRIRLRHSFLQEMVLSAVSIHFFFFFHNNLQLFCLFVFKSSYREKKGKQGR